MERLMAQKIYQKSRERNSYNPLYITKLLNNYRSHPNIIKISNDLFYEGELRYCGGLSTRIFENWNNILQPNNPVIFHGLKGYENKEGNSTRCCIFFQ